MSRRRVVLIATLAVAGCGEYPTDFSAGDDGGTLGTVSVDQSGGGADGGGAANEFPCEVRALLQARCVTCHGTPLTGAAPYALQTRAQLLAPSPSYPGQSVAQRSLARMQQASAPMPPAPATLPTAAELAAFAAWLDAGLPAGSCGGAASDAGTGQDAGPAPTTCMSSSRWTQGDRGSSQMHPGEACVACHASRKPSRAYFFMGTVYRSAHEQDNCHAGPPAGLVMEILHADGGVAYSMNVLWPSGNFYRQALGAGMPLPYRARVRNPATGQTLEMQTPQTSGDCNTCHTEQGSNGAAGRIVWPQ